MAVASSLPPEVSDFILPHQSDAFYAQALQTVVGKLSTGDLTILQLVTGLQEQLTGTNDAPRARATLLLAEAVRGAPESIEGRAQLAHLLDFFTARMSDWPALSGALLGCGALVARRRRGVDPALTDEEAGLAARTFIDEVHVPSFAVSERLEALQLLHALLEHYGLALLAAGVNVVEAAAAAVDGEKDPRCLLAGFAAARAAARLASTHSRAQLEEGAEELADVLSCYFPIAFTPPPNDVHGITRERLAGELAETLACDALLAPHVLPLVLEKLRSSLRQAKLDACALLPTCCREYGAAAVRPFLPDMWDALRPEVLAGPGAAAAAGPGGALGDVTQAAALACVTGCVKGLAAHGDLSLVSLVMQDRRTDDAMTYLRDGSVLSGGETQSLAANMVAALAAVCAGAATAAGQVCAALLPQLLAALPSAPPASSDDSGGDGSFSFTSAAGAGGAAAPPVLAPPLDSMQRQRQEAVLSAAGSLVAAARAAAAAEPSARNPVGASALPLYAAATALELRGEDSASTDALKVALLGSLLSFPTTSSPLASDHVSAALDLLLAIPCRPDVGGGAAPGAAANGHAGQVGGGGGDALLSAMMDALVAMVGAGWGPVVARSVPVLMQAPGAGGDAGVARLDCAARLARASAHLRGQVLAALPAAVAEAVQLVRASAPDAEVRLSALLSMLTQELLRDGDGGGGGGGWGGAAAGGDGEGAAAAALAGVLEALLLCARQVGERLSAATMAGCCDAIAAVARRSDAAVQAALAARACGTATRAAANEAGAGAAQLRQLAAAAALLIPLAPSALAGAAAELPAAFHALCRAAAAASPGDEERLARVLMVAAAAVINKADADLCAQLWQALQSHEELLPLQRASSAAGFELLGWLLRGMAMAGAAQTGAATRQLLLYLQGQAAELASPPSGVSNGRPASPMQPRVDSGDVLPGRSATQRAAASAFATVLRPGCGEVALGQAQGARMRPLWQQRFLVTSANDLLALMQDAKAAGSPPPPLLLLALLHLVTAAPFSLARLDASRLLPWLLRALAELPGHAAVEAGALVCALLFVSELLMDETGRALAETQLEALVSALVPLAGWRPAAAVRETALQVLVALTQLPYARVHPYRPQVLRAVGAALDDPKRAVRQAGVRCRAVWAAA